MYNLWVCYKGMVFQVKLIFSEKATKFSEIFKLLLTGTTQDKSKVKISQNFVDFSEYMNYNYQKARQIRSSNCIFRNLYYVCTDTYECSTWSYSLCMHSQYYNHLKICSVSFTRTKSSERKLSGVCCYFCGCPSTQCTKWEIFVFFPF